MRGECLPLPLIRGIPEPSPTDAVPPEPATRESGRWFGPGETVEIGGYKIYDAMLYVGSCMPGDEERRLVPAPCLVDPALPVAPDNADFDSGSLAYWPSYAGASPACRLAFLLWLAAGRKHPKVPVGFVFIFLRGLERRLLVDDPGIEEALLLMAEVRRLVGIYGEFKFSSYGKKLIQTAEARHLLDGPDLLEQWKPDADSLFRPPMPLPMKVAIAANLARGKALGADLAIGGLLCRRRTASLVDPLIHGARKAYLDLARLRFAEAFPDGFAPAAADAAELRIGYPLSQGFDVMFVPRDDGRAAVLWDPEGMDWSGAHDFACSVARELSEHATTAMELSAPGRGVPPEPRGAAPDGVLPGLRQWLQSFEDPVTEVTTAELCRRCFGRDGDQPNRDLVERASFLLPRLGYGMEPDSALFWLPRTEPVERAYVFQFPTARPLPAAYMMAMLVSVVLAGVETEPERSGERLVRFVEPFGLQQHELHRLAAFHRFRLDFGKAKTHGRYVGKVPEDERTGLAETVISAIGRAPEDASVGTMVAEKLSQLTGIGRKRMRGLMIEGMAAPALVRALADEGPVVVYRGGSPPGFRIPPPPGAPFGGAAPAPLDLERIRRIEHETSEASAILARIYDEEGEEPAPAAPTPPAPPPPSDPRFDGLDEDHAAFAAMLSARASWTRLDFDRAANDAGLMPGGALETLNEWSWGKFGDEFLEDGDPVTVAVQLLNDGDGVV